MQLICISVVSLYYIESRFHFKLSLFINSKIVQIFYTVRAFNLAFVSIESFSDLETARTGSRFVLLPGSGLAPTFSVGSASLTNRDAVVFSLKNLQPSLCFRQELNLADAKLANQ